ncbi:beta-galactosidase, partial [bacterium]|nr:beta-galactosidase [bacterium]
MVRSRVSALLCALCLFSCCMAGEAFRFADDFQGHKPGSDGAPVWTTDGFDWKVEQGRYKVTAFGRDLAHPVRAPHARQVVVEATLVLRQPVSQEWKTAGVALVTDERNFWHLALVEGPAKEKKRHFVELCEMLDGAWLSQSAEATRLTETQRKNSELDWQYGTPYRLKLTLGEDGIRGSVADAAGNELAAIAYKLDNRAVKTGRPTLSCNGFAAVFDDVAIACAQPVPAPAKEKWMFPPYTQAGRVPLPDAPKGKATGFFHVEQTGGRWWTIDPKGKPFFIVGTDHASYKGHWCEKLGYAPYGRNMQRQFPDEAQWAESTAERLLDWGFNTVAAGHSPSLRNRGLAWKGFVAFGSTFSNISDLCPKTTWTGFPNVFHPRFAAYCDRRAERECARYKDDPWLLGYFLDNELEWYGKEHREWSLVDEVFKKRANHTGKQALLAFLKQRYPTIERLNKAWGTAVASYGALANSTTVLEHTTDQGLEDKIAFLRVIAEKYFSITTAAIKRHDPNHMILGCRFAGRMPGGLGAIAGKYCDIYTINCYRTIDLETGEIHGFEKDLAEWYAEVKRPFAITEWSFPALDSGLPCKHGAGMRVDTQQQKARCFTLFQRLLFAT